MVKSLGLAEAGVRLLWSKSQRLEPGYSQQGVFHLDAPINLGPLPGKGIFSVCNRNSSSEISLPDCSELLDFSPSVEVPASFSRRDNKAFFFRELLLFKEAAIFRRKDSLPGFGQRSRCSEFRIANFSAFLRPRLRPLEWWEWRVGKRNWKSEVFPHLAGFLEGTELDDGPNPVRFLKPNQQVHGLYRAAGFHERVFRYDTG